MKSEPNIVPAAGPDIPTVRELWREYWDSLGLPPDFQGFAGELASLPGVYAPPQGRLLLAMTRSVPAGTAALRPLAGSACEAKRLYVRPQFRGSGIGGMLLERLIQEARAAGYREMYGDTLPSMQAALKIYDRFGFTRVGPYAAQPTPGAISLRLAI